MKDGDKIKVPTVGQWFDVKPLSIDQLPFRFKRDDEKQESTRQIILEAFEELNRNSEKYGKNFKTMIPKRYGEYTTLSECNRLAYDFGCHIADWVEQAMEWAQRITNGESWEAICNKFDYSDYYRLIIWKNKKARLIGGSLKNYNYMPVSNVGSFDYDDFHKIFYTLPLFVLYEE